MSVCRAFVLVHCVVSFVHWHISSVDTELPKSESQTKKISPSTSPGEDQDFLVSRQLIMTRGSVDFVARHLAWDTYMVTHDIQQFRTGID